MILQPQFAGLEGEQKTVDDVFAAGDSCLSLDGVSSTTLGFPGEAGDPSEEGCPITFEPSTRQRLLLPQMMGFTLVMEQSTDVRHLRIQLLNKDHTCKFERIYDCTQMYKAGFPSRKNAEGIIDLIIKLCNKGRESAVKVTKGAECDKSSALQSNPPSVDLSLQFRRPRLDSIGMIDTEILEQMALDETISDHTDSVDITKVQIRDFALITIQNDILNLKLIMDALKWNNEERLQFENDKLRDTVSQLRSEMDSKDKRIADLEKKTRIIWCGFSIR